MAYKEQLAVLRRAIEAKDISIWNKWRKENENLEIDLSKAKLNGANLVGVDFSDVYMRDAILMGTNLTLANIRGGNLGGANLKGADLTRAKLREAKLRATDLSGANLSRADFTLANLSGANLSRVNLREGILRGCNLTEADLSEAHLRGAYFSLADLSGANLVGADLREAELTKANLSLTNLEHTDFEDVNMDGTILGLTNLSNSKNLDNVKISGPCIIDFATLQVSKPLPSTFLRKLGLPDNYIEYLPDFFDDNPLRLFPVFLSHNEEDKPFTRRLYEALIARNAQVWMDEKKIKPGDEIMGSISKAINVYDKMILVCSQQSLNSWWVDQELERIMEKERQYQKASGTKERLLIPIRIDDSILHWQDSKAASIRKYHIGDFTNWQNPGAFAKALDDLVAALNVDRPDGGIISQLKKD